VLKGSTWIVDRDFTFETECFRYEKVTNLGRSAVARNASSPANRQTDRHTQT